MATANTRYQVIRSMIVTMHPEAACQECPWKTPGPTSDALARAKNHVGETGHGVSLIRKTISSYYGAER